MCGFEEGTETKVGVEGFDTRGLEPWVGQFDGKKRCEGLIRE